VKNIEKQPSIIAIRKSGNDIYICYYVTPSSSQGAKKKKLSWKSLFDFLVFQGKKNPFCMSPPKFF